MKVQKFLEHHGIAENPFGEEDAQADHVFRDHCIAGTHHPAWDKIVGRPGTPSTSVVFGEKGSGKTALRLQLVDSVERYNAENPDKRVYVVEYDDFNTFLDSFRERLSGRRKRPDRALRYWRMWDHMDAILNLGVRKLVRGILDIGKPEDDHRAVVRPEDLSLLEHSQKRDLLMLAALYDHSYENTPLTRWGRLRKQLGYNVALNSWDFWLAIAVTVVTTAIVLWMGVGNIRWWGWMIVGIVLLAGWFQWGIRQLQLSWKAWRVKRQIRVFDVLAGTLRRILGKFSRQDLAGQPFPTKDRSDDRYELLQKFQSVLSKLGFNSILVLVDRVDEPHLINGSPERMRDLLWPIFDNKFLKHPGIAFKLLLPAEVTYYLNREEKEFYERSRLDKQNLIPSLEWTGESLYDVAADRLKACSSNEGQAPSINKLFDDQVTRDDLIRSFSKLRVPRHLFKFLYRLLVEHCNRYTEDEPKWEISRETFESQLSLYLRDLDAYDRGMGTG
ncbi:hypothetical protein [Stratiformator vulcanicus]|uniref:KAP family P-loop domain protein n=1 Tax=Stratiformator vulcanicus TaxID=2527980 RepID=A0A517R387_9PLAN|nr:hypothetical protein [Stratiformator vulcanicus]QDT38342.1 hypothetical protein Pan189_27330 [Stratiformator vulcanicus]